MNQINIVKTKVAAATTVAVLLLSFAGVGNALAAFSAVNLSTGFSSLNTVEAEGEDEFTLVNTNFGGVVNLEDIMSNTGSDTTDSNTGSGVTDTSNIVIEGGFGNLFNSNDSTYTNSWWDHLVASENNTTGAESENDAEAEFENEIDVVQTNDAELSNDIGVDANTGENSADTNTGSGTALTGNATSTTTQANVANGNSFTSSGSMMNALFANMARNITTGFSSTNDAESEVENEMDVVNTNNALFGNLTDALLNTGRNSSDSNTGSGMADTGNAEGNASILNDANANNVDVTIVGADTNSLLAVNDTTGAESDNDSETEVESEIDVVSTNDAHFNSEAILDVNTGDNTSSTNTGMGDVKTGKGEGVITIENGGGPLFSNNNSTELNFTSSMFDLLAGNTTTGFMSDNDSETELENEVDVVNTNTANVGNTADTTIVTGENVSDSNTGSGEVDTRDAESTTSITNDLNVNSTTVSWMAMGIMSGFNDTTGAMSTNDVEVDVENELTIINTNTATVTNTSTVDSNTGGNSSSMNTGSGSSTTGNSSVMFGIINQGNGNFNIVN